MGNAFVVHLVRQMENYIRYSRCCNDFPFNLLLTHLSRKNESL